MQDGEILCLDCAERNLRKLIEALVKPVGYDLQWCPLALVDVADYADMDVIDCGNCCATLHNGG